MIKFKKYLVASIATLMCLSPVFAADTSTDDHSTNLNYTVEQSYKWTAPADITFATNIDTETKSGTVTVIENIIAGNETLKILIDTNAVFQIESAEHSIRNYKVLKDSDELSAGSLVLEVPSGTNVATQDLNFVLQGVVNGNTSQVAGTYTGTLNFVANIETTGSSNPGGSGSEGGSTVSVAKGQIVTMSELGLTNVDINNDSITDTFRVLSVDGTNVTLLAMDVYKKAFFGFNSTYSGSTLDTEMTNYYNALPSDVQSAIAEQNINQGTYSVSGSSSGSDILHVTDLDSVDIYFANTATTNVGNRNVFALDIQDVIDYLDADITGVQLNELFFNTTESVSRNVWLRSASANYDGQAFYMSNGCTGIYGVSSVKYEVRPAFVLNLG